MSDLEKYIPRLHVITDTQCQHQWSHIDLAREALIGGAKLIQYRDKYQESARKRLSAARALQALCEEHRATLIINDRADIAACVKAGLHLGPTDLSIADARGLIGPAPVVGATINRPDHARALLKHPPDYVGIGPFRASPNKEAATYGLGLEGMNTLLKDVQSIMGEGIPAIAIGGIRLEDVAPLIQLGFHGIAIIGAIAKAPSPQHATRSFISAIESAVERQ